MMPVFDLTIATRGGVCDLARVVDVLALLSLTPLSLKADGEGSGFSIRVRLRESARLCELCVARLRVLVQVRDVELVPVACDTWGKA